MAKVSCLDPHWVPTRVPQWTVSSKATGATGSVACQMLRTTTSTVRRAARPTRICSRVITLRRNFGLASTIFQMR